MGKLEKLKDWKKEDILNYLETFELIPMRQIYASSALTGLLSNPEYLKLSDENLIKKTFSIADAMENYARNPKNL